MLHLHPSVFADEHHPRLLPATRRGDLAREIPVGDEVYTAEDILDNGFWKEDFDQWDMKHADKYECNDDDELALGRREQAFESWLEEMKSVYLG